jgi:hypothetical protein
MAYFLLEANPLPQQHTDLEAWKLYVSILGFLAVVISLAVGFWQQRRAERWRLGEFIDKQVRDFLADPYVRNALLMVDWGHRKINIDQKAGLPDNDGPLITRGIQWRALLPHDVKERDKEYSDRALLSPSPVSSPPGAAAGDEEDIDIFTPAEAKIRETYDAMLDHLERFSNLIELNLVKPKYFEPYLRYWIEAMAGNADLKHGATWRFVLLNYINFYDYDGVVKLFKQYGKDIGPDGGDFKQRRAEMIDNPPENANLNRQILADRLKHSLDRKLKPQPEENEGVPPPSRADE